MTPLVTGLYVPADRPERFAKAVASGAQLVILDLEDAVAEGHKAAARQHVVDWLESPDTKPSAVEVRVNAGSAVDLEALAAVSGDFAVRLPKVESPSDVDTALANARPRHPDGGADRDGARTRSSVNDRRPPGRRRHRPGRGRPGE